MGKIDRKRNEIVYEQVPLNTLFFPVLFDEETMLDIARPFIIYAGTTLEDIPLPLTANTPPHSPKDISIENGNIIDSDTRKAIKELRYITLECDTTQHTDLHLLRKYPDKRRMRAFREQLKGAVLVGSDDERRSFDTLLTIKETPQPYLQEYKFKNEKCYRFYRLSAPTGASVNISHMEFLTSSPKGNAFRSPTPLPVFHKDTVSDTEKMHRVEGRPLKTGSHPEYAFDNNMSTYAGSSSVGMEFRHPVQIDRIRLVPRNANNMIVPGNSYLLMYYDNGWKEFKILYAEHNYLDFKRVPKATLYWLRNLTEGKEELPFFYIDGKQYFCIQINSPTVNKLLSYLSAVSIGSVWLMSISGLPDDIFNARYMSSIFSTAVGALVTCAVFLFFRSKQNIRLSCLDIAIFIFFMLLLDE